MVKGVGCRSHLEEEGVLADPLNRRQQVALQRDVRGLPAAQKHAALQRDSTPSLKLAKDNKRIGPPSNSYGVGLSKHSYIPWKQFSNT